MAYTTVTADPPVLTPSLGVRTWTDEQYWQSVYHCTQVAFPDSIGSYVYDHVSEHVVERDGTEEWYDRKQTSPYTAVWHIGRRDHGIDYDWGIDQVIVVYRLQPSPTGNDRIFYQQGGNRIVYSTKNSYGGKPKIVYNDG